MRLASLALLIACAFVGCSSSSDCDNCRCPNDSGQGHYRPNGVLAPGAAAPK